MARCDTARTQREGSAWGGVGGQRVVLSAAAQPRCGWGPASGTGEHCAWDPLPPHKDGGSEGPLGHRATHRGCMAPLGSAAPENHRVGVSSSYSDFMAAATWRHVTEATQARGTHPRLHTPQSRAVRVCARAARAQV